MNRSPKEVEFPDQEPAIDELTEEEMESLIGEFFESNYERLRLEGGHALTPHVKKAALDQVLHYWRKLRNVAESVTNTEVKLTLPEQTTPDGRRFTLEGVVDIVREDDRTVMYDIKTHDPDYVRANLGMYEKQLNVYAHIWQGLRGQPLDQTAIIATAFPETLRDAINSGSQTVIARELEKWEPLIDIPISQSHVEDTIREFGEVVDAIECRQFAPPPVERLQSRLDNTRQLYATRICRNCDARFSCSSYRNYAYASGNRTDFQFSQYFNDWGSEADRSERIAVTLEVSRTIDELERNIEPIRTTDAD